MLALRNRLKRQRDFENVFKTGKGFQEGPLYLKVQKNNFQASRFGFIVSKKFSKKAVERNRAKRVLREVIKKNLSQIKAGLDIIIVLNPEAKTEELEKTTERLFKKAKIL